MGHIIGALDRLDTLQTKLSKFATELGPAALRALGFDNKTDFVKNNSIFYKATLDLTTCRHRLMRPVGAATPTAISNHLPGASLLLAV
jgi:hypothetical protein